MFGEKVLQDKGFKLLNLALTAVAFVMAYYVKKHGVMVGGLSTGPNYYMILMTVLVCSALSFDFFNIHELYRQKSLEHAFITQLKAVSAATGMVVVLLYLFQHGETSRLLLVLFFVFDIFLLTSVHVFVRRGVANHRRKDFNRQKILVIGSMERARDLVTYIAASEDLGYQILGCLDVDPKRIGVAVTEKADVIGTVDNFYEILLNKAVDEVIFAMPLKKIYNAIDYISFAEKLGVKVRVLPDWQIQKMMYQPEIASVQIESFVGIPTLTLSSTPRKVFELFVKAVCDRIAAILGLLLLSPFFALVALLIKLESKGPIFFRQQRSGLNGRIFTLYKFRSMVSDAEARKADLQQSNEMDGPVFKMANDPRITRIGAFLRKTSLDELPQLINVARGEMSLVGPRPPLPQEVQEYEPWQRRRLSMKPGLTCIWQVSGRNDINFEQWMKMDLEYIDRWSLWFDVQLLAKTVPAVVLGTGR